MLDKNYVISVRSFFYLLDRIFSLGGVKMDDQGTINRDAWLVINKQVIPIDQIETTIGRNLENDIVIQDQVVSRYHAKIRFEDGTYVLYDLNSTGGSYVNNKRVERAALNPGDVIILAIVPFLYVEDIKHLTGQGEMITNNIDDPLSDKETVNIRKLDELKKLDE
jgi:hypothetical protein